MQAIGVERVEMFRCTHCRTVYPTEQEAKDCAALGWDQIHQPGDIVVDVRACGLWMDDHTRAGVFDHPDSKTGRAFCSIPGVYPENDPWIFLHGKSLHDRPGIAVYWVIGAVTAVFKAGCKSNRAYDRHRSAYHLFSEAGCSEGGCLSGWTTHDGHIPVMKPPGELAAELVERSKKYIGKQVKHLLNTY